MSETAQQEDERARTARREIARDLVDLETMLIRNGGVEMIVRLVDLSHKGFHARCATARFDRGDVVTLDLPLIGFTPGRVMWGLKDCFGCQFSRPIDAPTYDALLAQIRAETPHDPASAAR